ncbi:hypothetical protein EJ07DRAFT_155775 [Lizonia empirigonia]|nr:hypothetical protein EJ07DRAFT_155775 [Lizonia empirigonia]
MSASNLCLPNSSPPVPTLPHPSSSVHFRLCSSCAVGVYILTATTHPRIPKCNMNIAAPNSTHDHVSLKPIGNNCGHRFGPQTIPHHRPLKPAANPPKESLSMSYLTNLCDSPGDQRPRKPRQANCSTNSTTVFAGAPQPYPGPVVV